MTPAELAEGKRLFAEYRTEGTWYHGEALGRWLWEHADELIAIAEQRDALAAAILCMHGEVLPPNWVYTDSLTTIALVVAEVLTLRKERDELAAALMEIDRPLYPDESITKRMDIADRGKAITAAILAEHDAERNAEIQRLRAALQPFADWYRGRVESPWGEWLIGSNAPLGVVLTRTAEPDDISVEHLRQADAALKGGSHESIR
jgi:hypothetical protein